MAELTSEWCRTRIESCEHEATKGLPVNREYHAKLAAALRIAARVLDEGAVDTCWEQLKRRCCSTRPESPGWDDVSAIVMFRKADLKAVINYLLEGKDQDDGR